jgi:predicted small secreted protein
MKNLKLVLACLMATALMGCNTIAGLGQDLQNLGSVVDKNTSKKSDSGSEASNSGVVVTPVK